eukprot:TRINITY_DN2993_c0_g1_i4.p1 TRINITY_DN2993_c0_g1~~TRINITY_DN2993_c0_g1_i4.p1  ORF type:complete len:207 (+),score=29.42 TRINITY_DN2993_c0_g1_i4:53-673(+)
MLSRIRTVLATLQSQRDPTLFFLVDRSDLSTHSLEHNAHTPKRNGDEIVVFASSFNPPTLSHREMCVSACREERIGRVLLLLATNNADKGAGAMASETRLEMLVAFAEEQNRSTDLGWSVAACNSGIFVDKVTALRKHFPISKLIFLVGYDTLIRIFNPSYYKNFDESMHRSGIPLKIVVWESSNLLFSPFHMVENKISRNLINTS